MKLYFNHSLVSRLLDHSIAASRRKPTFGQSLERKYREPGAPERPFPEADDIDQTKIPAGLWLVGDEGVYFVSNGLPALMTDDGKQVVAYADGANPEENPLTFDEIKRESFGGDDGVEFINLEHVLLGLEATRDGKLWIDLTPDGIAVPRLATSRPKPAPKRKARKG
ncbi:DUF3085 domain-containing protein [Acetobacter sacchari]|uniref:DUF3085 domain-containing protein n=1 Tax=Acetobacter sacchari TaxID=2661687 RepID=A0ABS3LWF8_9PROT|nr:DUF3085 domain-containing protein [Acetobacter sacchari]MBO1360268.1 DUF3085 domain-containing protein [Acetobacter sacchari]